jgi:hypothetical protein
MRQRAALACDGTGRPTLRGAASILLQARKDVIIPVAESRMYLAYFLRLRV